MRPNEHAEKAVAEIYRLSFDNQILIRDLKLMTDSRNAALDLADMYLKQKKEQELKYRQAWEDYIGLSVLIAWVWFLMMVVVYG